MQKLKCWDADYFPAKRAEILFFGEMRLVAVTLPGAGLGKVFESGPWKLGPALALDRHGMPYRKRREGCWDLISHWLLNLLSSWGLTPT